MTSPRNVLLVGGRLPAALELARLLGAAGHRVVSADTVRWHLLRFSSAVASNHLLPPPRAGLSTYAAALRRIAETERIDLLLPTSEEIFWIALAAGELRDCCSIFADELEKLDGLHNKWRFIERGHAHGLAVPRTILVKSSAELHAALGELGNAVLKPVYSRFAARTVVRPRVSADLVSVRPTDEDPWVVQEFVAGRQICTYGVAHSGRLTAHAVYPAEHTLGSGAAITFRAVDHPAARDWVERFVAAERFTGQIGFDLIETPGGVVGIECNPRATSGVHLFANDLRLVQALFERKAPIAEARPGKPSMLAVAMLMSARRHMASRSVFFSWWRTFWRSRDAVFRWQDPLPALGRYVQILGIGWTALSHRVSVQRALSLDVEWNGERSVL